MPSKKGSTRKRKNAVSPPSPQSFQFINFTDAPHPDDDDRDIIRSKAISDYHQRKRNHNPRSSVESTNRSLQPSTSKFRLLPQSHVPDSRIASTAVQYVRPGQRIYANNFGSQSLPASGSNIPVSRSDDLSRDHGMGLPPATNGFSFGMNTTDYDKAIQPYFSRDRMNREGFVENLDLLATNLDPPLNLPINSSPKMRLWIHHYCEPPVHKGEKQGKH